MFHFRLGLLVAVCVVCAWAASTTNHPPRTTKEPSERESVSFSYSGITHNMYIKVYEKRLLKCYIAVLSDAEKMSVHSDAGLRTAELKYLGMIDSATMVDKTAVSAGDVKACGHSHGRNGTIQYFNIM